VYDATIAYNHIIYRLDEHLDRFYNSAAMLRIPEPMEKSALAALLQDLVNKVDSPSQFVYWQVTRGTASRLHSFPQRVKPNLWVMLRPEKTGVPREAIREKFSLITVEDTRYFHCNIKTLNLIPNVMASEAAREQGCNEAVFHRNGRVTECSHCNVHILKNGALRTAPLDNLILPGVARARIIAQCLRLGIPVVEEAFSIGELMDADEVLISSSSLFCRSASFIDGKPVGGKAPELLGMLQDALIDEFLEAVGG
jgi:D-alanine transaminase